MLSPYRGNDGCDATLMVNVFYPQQNRRRTMRLVGYNYSALGSYFVTICTHQRKCLFGEIVEGKMRVNSYGQIVKGCWEAIPKHFPHANLQNFVVMPNHVHGVVMIEASATEIDRHHAQEKLGNMMKPGTLSTIVRSFKSVTTKQINILRDSKGSSVWQRNYYDHIIRDERSFVYIQNYITNNPSTWQQDQLRPKNAPSPKNKPN